MVNPKLRATGINHVVLHVADLDRSRTFYLEVLGFDDRGSGPPGFRASFLRCGTQGLDLFEITDRDVHGGEDMNHLALNVHTDDVEEVVSALASAGIDALEITRGGRYSSPTRTATGLRSCRSAPASGNTNAKTYDIQGRSTRSQGGTSANIGLHLP